MSGQRTIPGRPIGGKGRRFPDPSSRWMMKIGLGRAPVVQRMPKPPILLHQTHLRGGRRIPRNLPMHRVGSGGIDHRGLVVFQMF
jgi:hypothetical protein